MYGYENGKKIFSIPVEWTVTEEIDIKADSLKEAIDFIVANADRIPLGAEPEYVSGSWKISADEGGTMDAGKIVTALEDYGYSESEADEACTVEAL